MRFLLLLKVGKSGYQVPRTSHKPQVELLSSPEYGMRVRSEGELDHVNYILNSD